MEITLKELLDFEFTANEDGEVIALVPLSRVNEIADILTNQKERIDKAIEYIKENKARLTIGRDEFTCEMRYSDDVVLADKLLEILGDKEND